MSTLRSTIEDMFESVDLPAVAVIASRDNAGLVDAISGAVRLERATAARRLFAVGELFLRREAERDASERESWRVDGWDYVAAEVAAAQGISRHKAAAQIRMATTLREELPHVAAVFADGLVDYWIIRAIVSRVFLVDDPEDIARLDAGLATQVHRWNRLSKKKVNELIDSWVVTVDHLAKRRETTRDDDRCIELGTDCDGVAEIRGSLRAAVAAAFDARLDELAATVCPSDPRTKTQRRSDAAESMALGHDRLACQCARDDCSAGDPPKSNVVIHVVADAATVYGDAPIPGYVSGYGALPPEMVRDLVRTAKLTAVPHPGEPPCETSYRPTAAQSRFVRCRDLTCRFPGCDVPAEACQIDHTIPWPYGPTHPSNLKLLCVFHHLLKTFYSSWRDIQRPDGTVTWTSPTGHTYTTKPGGALFFPQLTKPTGKLTLSGDIPQNPNRCMAMPTRTRTRATDRRARIEYERGLNYQEYLLRPQPDPEPPPF